MKVLYDCTVCGRMRVAGLMSGSGSNVRKILEQQKELKDEWYRVVVIFSDRFDSNAAKIGKEYDLPVVVRDIQGFYKARGKKRSDFSIRPDFDREVVKVLKTYDVEVAAYGGYMSVASSVLVNAFIGVNVHPADLSIEREGNRVYVGSHAVRDAMNAGEKYLRSTTHLVNSQLDGGPILMVSKPLEVITGKTSDEMQVKLKEEGDWVIFPKTLEFIAQGRYAMENGLLYFDGKPIPKGVRWDEFNE